jgi:hypothetical protein
MGLVSPAVHRVLDFLVVVAFALAPTLFHFSGRTVALAYGLAVVHLLITLATHFPGRGRYPVPFRAHGIVELLVGLGLVVVPLVRHWTHGARVFYPGIGVAILLAWALTRYGETRPAAATATSA